MVEFFIVDDEDVIRNGLVNCVDWEKLGARAIGSEINGSRAVHAIMKLDPDVVITDVVMPKMDGIELSRNLRTRGWDGEIIFISAYQDMDYVKSAFKMAAVDYLFKPIQNEELNSVIRNVIRKVNAGKERQRAQWKADHDLLSVQCDKLWHDVLNPVAGRRLCKSEWATLLPGRDHTAAACVLLVRTDGPQDEVRDALMEWKDTVRGPEAWIHEVNGREIAVILLSGPLEDAFEEHARQLEVRLHRFRDGIRLVRGDCVRGIGRLEESMRSARVRLEWGCFLPGDPGREAVDQERGFTDRLADAILGGNADGIRAVLRAFLKDLASRKDKDIDRVRLDSMVFCCSLADDLFLAEDAAAFDAFRKRVSL